MKIYMVNADNGLDYEYHAWWNVDAFTSEEAAQTYIAYLPEIIAANERRIDELEELRCKRELTESEANELSEIKPKWGIYWHFFDHGSFWIQEFEIR